MTFHNGGPVTHSRTTFAIIFFVVIFFESLLVLASAAILWFTLYVVYRLVTDES